MIDVDHVHHADAFDLLPLIDGESIDLIVCDGPYGVTTNKWDRIGNIQEYALNTIQKPEQLIERLVQASSREGDLVLDPFAGVGTCPAVCKRLGRHFIAIERDEQFVRAARNRLQHVEADLAARLF